MVLDPKFDDIRPYNDAETEAAVKRLVHNQYIDAAGAYIYPDKPEGHLSEMLKGIKTTDDLQYKVVSDVIARIVATTTSGLTVGGLENFTLSDGSIGRFLILSTHRDIVLDPAFIQFLLYKSNLPLTQIAVGDNLIKVPAVEDMMRSNRMIKVVRSSNPRVVYETSKVLSEYVRLMVSSGESSIWIAHRQGRTKDGYDVTAQGILKMFDMSGEGSFYDNFATLPILPVAISYEYETCGALKCLELAIKEINGEYTKQQNEDLNSMLQGFKQFKGHVHVQFCKPITLEEIQEADLATKNEKFTKLAKIIDRRLWEAYKLWPTNYIAADLLSGKEIYKNKQYTEAEKEAFLKHIKEETEGMPELVTEKILSLYAAHIVGTLKD